MDSWEPVRRWRQEVLERAGYPEVFAQIVAGCPEVDLHKAVEMVREGCDPFLATKILI